MRVSFHANPLNLASGRIDARKDISMHTTHALPGRRFMVSEIVHQIQIAVAMMLRQWPDRLRQYTTMDVFDV